MDWHFTYLRPGNNNIDTMIYRNHSILEAVHHFVRFEDFKDVRLICICGYKSEGER